MTAHSAMLFFLGPEPELVFAGFKVALLSAWEILSYYRLGVRKELLLVSQSPQGLNPGGSGCR